jgi:hypothetical protein
MASHTLIAFLIIISLVAVFGVAFSINRDTHAQESTIGDNSNASELAAAELARDPEDLVLTGQGTAEEELARDPGDLLLYSTAAELARGADLSQVVGNNSTAAYPSS